MLYRSYRPIVVWEAVGPIERMGRSSYLQVLHVGMTPLYAPRARQLLSIPGGNYDEQPVSIP
jgi:hypothetical protein